MWFSQGGSRPRSQNRLQPDLATNVALMGEIAGTQWRDSQPGDPCSGAALGSRHPGHAARQSRLRAPGGHPPRDLKIQEGCSGLCSWCSQHVQLSQDDRLHPPYLSRFEADLDSMGMGRRLRQDVPHNAACELARALMLLLNDLDFHAGVYLAPLGSAHGDSLLRVPLLRQPGADDVEQRTKEFLQGPQLRGEVVVRLKPTVLVVVTVVETG